MKLKKQYLILIICILTNSLFAQVSDSDTLSRLDNKSDKFLIKTDKVRYGKTKTVNAQYEYLGKSPYTGPQIFLTLTKDSVFKWDAWYGSDAYIACGKYTVTDDNILILKSDSILTKQFTREYKKSNRKWKWYNPIYFEKQLIYATEKI